MIHIEIYIVLYITVYRYTEPVSIENTDIKTGTIFVPVSRQTNKQHTQRRIKLYRTVSIKNTDILTGTIFVPVSSPNYK